MLTIFIACVLLVWGFAHALVYLKINYLVILTPSAAIEVLTDGTFLSEIIAVVASMAAVFLAYKFIKSEYEKYQYYREQRIYTVSLQELAQIWGSGKMDIVKKETVPVLYLKNFMEERTRSFIARYMEKNMRFFPQEKLEIIFDLLKILETEGIKAPSVASMFRSDPEKTGNYQAVVTQDGKTSYDIFSEISLYDHSLNVAEKAVEYLKEKDPISYETSLCDGIIVALAHDIGKLQKISQFNKEYPNEILLNNPHQAISKMFFAEMWPGYSAIEDAIYNHHSAPNSGALLTRMIIDADKKARAAEMLDWQTKRNSEKKQKETGSGGEADSKKEASSESEDEKPLEKMQETVTEKKSRSRTRVPEQASEPQKFIIAKPEPTEVVEFKRQEPEQIDYTDELERKIFDDLRLAINKYTLEKVQGISSISHSDTILFSVLFFNSIVKKHVYTNGDNPDEIRRIGQFIASKMYEKGYTNYMTKDFGCSTFFLSVSGKRYKFICIPIKSEVFNMDAFALDQNKDAWLKSIEIDMARN